MVGADRAVRPTLRVTVGDSRMDAAAKLLWPIPSTEQITHELREADERTLEERVERAVYVRQMAEPGPMGWSIPGGPICGFAWWEAGRSFIAGNFLASILLVQATVEHSLAMVLDRTGRPTRGLTFKRLIDLAYDAGVVDTTLAGRLHRLRLMRNPYVHADVSAIEDYIGRAQSETDGDPYALNDVNARVAVEIGVDFIREISRTWGGTPSSDGL
jgi:hypothetical protein